MAALKRTILASIGVAFAVYWMWTAELPGSDTPASLAPVIPSNIRPLPEPAKKRLDDFANSGLMRASGNIRGWLTREAAKMSRSRDASSAANVIRLKRKALTLRSEDIHSLRDVALDGESTGTLRYLAVYVLSLSESSAARDALKEIGRSQVPASPDEKGYSEEISVRTQALEFLLKRLSARDRSDVLHDIVSKSSDPNLVRRAQYWLSRQ